MFQVVPVQDIRKVLFRFPIPDDRKRYRSQATNFIGLLAFCAPCTFLAKFRDVMPFSRVSLSLHEFELIYVEVMTTEFGRWLPEWRVSKCEDDRERDKVLQTSATIPSSTAISAHIFGMRNSVGIICLSRNTIRQFMLFEFIWKSAQHYINPHRAVPFSLLPFVSCYYWQLI